MYTQPITQEELEILEELGNIFKNLSETLNGTNGIVTKSKQGEKILIDDFSKFNAKLLYMGIKCNKLAELL